MKKRLLLFSALLALLLCVSAQAQTQPLTVIATAPSDSAVQVDTTIAPLSVVSSPLVPAFERTQTYAGSFSDVPEDKWYAPSIAALYEYGLTQGRANGRYDPDGSVTVAELLTFSARVHARYTGNTLPPQPSGSAWYQVYVDYLRQQGLLDTEFEGLYTTPATRAQMAGIFFRTLPEECYDNRNAMLVSDGYALGQYITDVNDYTPHQYEIIWLYKQGILSGVDSLGTFRPDNTVRRSEVAAMLTRMIDPSLRLTLTWNVLPYPTAIGTTYKKLIPAPETVPTAPSATDAAAIDAVVRQVLRSDTNTITLTYPDGLTSETVAALTRAFTSTVKSYCEQMYNAVTCKAYSSGRAYLTFSSTACTNAELVTYREQTLAQAIVIHDALWESGYIYKSMSEYEKARAYFIWLCENCAYDSTAMGDSASLSHLAYNVFANGRAVCDGYVGAYNLLLKLEGIECTALFNTDHIWTVATLDGVSYHIDPTWGDQGMRADMSCFGMTEEQSYAMHPW